MLNPVASSTTRVNGNKSKQFSNVKMTQCERECYVIVHD